MTPQQLVQATDYMGYLHDRWQDEREYECFEEYKTAIKKMLPGATNVNLTMQPFRVTYMLDGEKLVHYIKVTPTKTETGTI